MRDPPGRRGLSLDGGLLWETWREARADPGTRAARRASRLDALVRFARARSPLYGELYERVPANSVRLDDLPPVTKPALMARFDAWVTDPAVTRAGVDRFLADPSQVGRRYLDRYRVMTTSGVTGVRGVFLHDAVAVARYRALTLVRGFLPRLTPRAAWRLLVRGNRVAALLTTGGHYGGSTVFQAARQEHPWPFNRIRVLGVARPLPELVRELNGFRPAQLIGYPAALRLVADEQEAGRLRIRPGLVATGGDWLGPETRARINRAFGQSVRQNYGASEFPPLAWDCGRGALHVSDDWAILEPVDASYRPVPAGELSATVLLTNLANRVQPLIRYDLGDAVALEPAPCPCGRPWPTIRVEGRRDDTLTLRTPEGRLVTLVPNALRRVTGESPGVALSQVVQEGPDAVGVRLDAVPGADPEAVWAAMRARLGAYLADHGLAHVTVRRRPEPPQADPGTGKIRRVVADGVTPPQQN